MRVLIVTERFFPEVGAAPSRLTNMAQGLCEKGIDVDVLTSLPNYPKGEIFHGYKGKAYVKDCLSGCNVFRFWTYATISKNPIKRALNMMVFSIMLWLFAFKINRCRSYDVVIIQSPSLFVAVSSMILFKKCYKRKCVLNISDIWPSTAVDMGVIKEDSKVYKVMSWCERYLYKSADGILGQSNDILKHISHFETTDKVFLYRNLQRYEIVKSLYKSHTPLRIVYAGLLGYAQDVLSIVKEVDFKGLGVEFHIVGGGGQYEEICRYLQNTPDSNVFMHGSVPKDQMSGIYSENDAAIVPLAANIYGAFPSKIYDILPFGLPILFCGSGEGAEFVSQNGLGYVSAPGDYSMLNQNVRKLTELSESQFDQIRQSCLSVAEIQLNFDNQINDTIGFLSSL
jgi:glycosyltransferase involved in cell wall biosynthesis